MFDCAVLRWRPVARAVGLDVRAADVSARRRGRAAWLSAGVVAGIALLVGIVPSPACAASWTLQSAPAPQVANGALSAVNCTSSTACTAVGSFTDGAGFTVTLAERWNGTSWARQAMPNASLAQLHGVRCPTTTVCVAVGSAYDSAGTQVTLIERWNGTSWSIQSSPNPDGAVASELSGVTCTSASACIAVGSAFFPGATPTGGWRAGMLVERWDGVSWSTQTIAAPADATETFLRGISCASSTACTAVGTVRTPTNPENQPLAAGWDGIRWSAQAIQSPSIAEGASLDAVSCRSDTVCVAVGSFYSSGGDAGGAWSAHRNGSTWSVLTLPDASGLRSVLSAVSCTAPTACTAVGATFPTDEYSSTVGVPLAVRWNGTNWSIQRTPPSSTTRSSSLEGVSCGSSASCVAVGSSYLNGASLPLAQRWDGTGWSLQTTANVTGAADSRLTGVRCTSSTACSGVGSYTTSAGTRVTLAERWNGTTWSIQTTPNPTGALESWFTDVTCTSSTACTAVGAYRTSTDTYPLAERWNGTNWSIQPVTSFGGRLEAVSCSSVSACTAVGEFWPGPGAAGPFAARWNGTSWSVQATPDATGFLSGVSCPTGTACTAVGSIGYYDGTLAERWNGSSWAIQATPAGREGALSSVSCPTSTACTAVGTLVERWNGTSWATQPTVTPTGTRGGTFDGVTCPATTGCVAVGSSNDGTFYDRTLAERWNGTAWVIEATPNPVGANHLRAVSCAPGGTPCFAAGETSRVDGVQVPLVERST